MTAKNCNTGNFVQNGGYKKAIPRSLKNPLNP
jgi:hypothetical protein